MEAVDLAVPYAPAMDFFPCLASLPFARPMPVVALVIVVNFLPLVVPVLVILLPFFDKELFPCANFLITIELTGTFKP